MISHYKLADLFKKYNVIPVRQRYWEEIAGVRIACATGIYLYHEHLEKGGSDNSFKVNAQNMTGFLSGIDDGWESSSMHRLEGNIEYLEGFRIGTMARTILNPSKWGKALFDSLNYTGYDLGYAIGKTVYRCNERGPSLEKYKVVKYAPRYATSVDVVDEDGFANIGTEDLFFDKYECARSFLMKRRQELDAFHMEIFQ